MSRRARRRIARRDYREAIRDGDYARAADVADWLWSDSRSDQAAARWGRACAEARRLAPEEVHD